MAIEGESVSSANKLIKIWIVVSLCALLIWIIRLVPDSLERFYNIVFVSWNYYNRAIVGGSMYSLAAVGIIARLVGAAIGLASLLMVWNNKRSILDLRKWVATALSLESLYYASLIPAIIWLFALAKQSTISYNFGISYLIQIVFTVPFLAILAFKLVKNGKKPFSLHLWKWIGIAFLGYVIALWANSVFRWFDMIATSGVQFFFTDVRVVGALNAIVFMSLAVVFAALSAFSLAKQKESARIWMGLSLTMVGLHYTIFVVFSYLVGTLNSIWLMDVWTVPLLGLGLTILFIKKNEVQNVNSL